MFGRPPQLPLIVLSEVRLILRVFRRRGMDRQFPAVVEKLLEARRRVFWPPPSEPMSARFRNQRLEVRGSLEYLRPFICI